MTWGAQKPGGQCMLSTHMCTHTGNSRNGCRSANKHKSIASPNPLSPAPVSVSLSQYLCHMFSDRTTRNYGTHLVDSTLRSRAVSMWWSCDGLPLYLKVFPTFPIRVNIGEVMLGAHFSIMQSNTKPSQNQGWVNTKKVLVSVSIAQFLHRIALHFALGIISFIFKVSEFFIFVLLNWNSDRIKSPIAFPQNVIRGVENRNVMAIDQRESGQKGTGRSPCLMTN